MSLMEALHWCRKFNATVEQDLVFHLLVIVTEGERIRHNYVFAFDQPITEVVARNLNHSTSFDLLAFIQGPRINENWR